MRIAQRGDGDGSAVDSTHQAESRPVASKQTLAQREAPPFGAPREGPLDEGGMSRPSKAGDRAPDWVADGALMSAFGLDDAHCTTSDESNGHAAAQQRGGDALQAGTSVQKQGATTSAMQPRGPAPSSSWQQIDEPVASHTKTEFSSPSGDGHRTAAWFVLSHPLEHNDERYAEHRYLA